MIIAIIFVALAIAALYLAWLLWELAREADTPASDAAPTLAGTFTSSGPMPDGVWDNEALDELEP